MKLRPSARPKRLTGRTPKSRGKVSPLETSREIHKTLHQQQRYDVPDWMRIASINVDSPPKFIFFQLPPEKDPEYNRLSRIVGSVPDSLNFIDTLPQNSFERGTRAVDIDRNAPLLHKVQDATLFQMGALDYRLMINHVENCHLWARAEAQLWTRLADNLPVDKKQRGYRQKVRDEKRAMDATMEQQVDDHVQYVNELREHLASVTGWGMGGQYPHPTEPALRRDSHFKDCAEVDMAREPFVQMIKQQISKTLVSHASDGDLGAYAQYLGHDLNYYKPQVARALASVASLFGVGSSKQAGDFDVSTWTPEMREAVRNEIADDLAPQVVNSMTWYTYFHQNVEPLKAPLVMEAPKGYFDEAPFCGAHVIDYGMLPYLRARDRHLTGVRGIPQHFVYFTYFFTPMKGNAIMYTLTDAPKYEEELSKPGTEQSEFALRLERMSIYDNFVTVWPQDEKPGRELIDPFDNSVTDGPRTLERHQAAERAYFERMRRLCQEQSLQSVALRKDIARLSDLDIDDYNHEAIGRVFTSFDTAYGNEWQDMFGLEEASRHYHTNVLTLAVPYFMPFREVLPQWLFRMRRCFWIGRCLAEMSAVTRHPQAWHGQHEAQRIALYHAAYTEESPGDALEDHLYHQSFLHQAVNNSQVEFSQAVHQLAQTKHPMYHTPEVTDAFLKAAEALDTTRKSSLGFMGRPGRYQTSEAYFDHFFQDKEVEFDASATQQHLRDDILGPLMFNMATNQWKEHSDSMVQKAAGEDEREAGNEGPKT
eukprot:Clim_evm36s235 gene=Clim_evmTU36s235